MVPLTSWHCYGLSTSHYLTCTLLSPLSFTKTLYRLSSLPGEDTQQYSDIHTQSHNKHLSSRWQNSTQCFPKLSPVIALVLFSSDICCHQTHELKGSVEDSKILWHVLCQWSEERTWHNWSVLMHRPMCCQKISAAQWRDRQVVWATPDKSAALFSFHLIDINICIIPLVYSAGFHLIHHWNLSLWTEDNFQCKESVI